eukprot:404921-Amorphochlora_amoeboformis.AAC.1
MQLGEGLWGLGELDLLATKTGGRDRGAKNPDAMTELERISRWLMGDTFPKAPALLLLRDVVFLHKLLLEDTSLLK